MDTKTRKKLAEHINQLRYAASKAAGEGNTKVKVESEAKVRFLKEIYWKMRLNEREKLREMSVFISHSRNTGKEQFEVAKDIAEQCGFDVITGFDTQSKTNILTAVKENIQRAAVFLSIMTPEYQITSLTDQIEGKTAASVWVIEEKGMALAQDKPFRLLVNESVHEDFWKRTTPEKLNSIYTDTNFQKKAEEAIKALFDRYMETTTQALINEKLTV